MSNFVLRDSRPARLSFSIIALCLLLFGSFGASSSWAQSPTPGLIFKPATTGTPGSAVLDPNGDGYVSATAAGFSVAAGDVGTQSEIQYKYLPQRTTVEPNADLRVGPSNKFTDFADVAGGGNSVGFFVDAASNYLFRFRLGASAPNSKGYSIALDTDNKFGFTGPNADPNAIAHNPGFEIEIVLDTNFGVRLYNIDGTVSPTGTGPDNCLVELPYASYAQKAIAVTTNGGDVDVFYDFYIPLSVIQSNFGSQTYFNSTGTTAVPFSLTTALRMVASTLIAPHGITQYQNISDISGIDDTAYPNPDNAFIALVTGSTPTSGATVPTTSGTTIPARSVAPVVNSPIQTGATVVSGTSSEAAGTVITVYVNGTALGTTATVQTGGTWSLTGLSPLASGALVKATATATGKSVSDYSNVVQVMGSAICATTMLAAPTCVNPKGIYGAAVVGNWVYLRNADGTLATPSGLTTGNPVQANTSGVYLFSGSGGSTTNCGSGQSAGLAGGYFLTQSTTNNGSSCESAPYSVCVGTVTTATPVVSTARPITPATTSLAGTATSGATVLLYVNGVRYATTTATGGNYTFSTAAATLPALAVGQQLTVTALVAGTSCESAAVTLNVVASRAITVPVVNSPLVSGATTVSGTSSEAAGSTINLTTYAAADGTGAVVATYTPTVLSNGTWSVTVTTLTGGSVKATVTTVDYGTSGFSNVVPVQTRTASTPVITGTYSERGTSVSGTSAAAVGSIITVYEDGDIVGTTTVATGGTWTITGLSNASGVSPNTLYPTLYAGGVLTATATETGKLASAASAPVTVGCVTLANKAFSTTNVCQNNAAVITISSVEPGVVYTLQDATSGTNVTTGVSSVGTGSGTSSLLISTSILTTVGTYTIKLNAFSVGAVSCSQTTTSSVTVTVNPLPVTKTIAAQQATVGPSNTGTNITVASSESGVTYQLLNASTSPSSAVGTTQPGNGGTLSMPTGAITATTTYAVSAVSAYPCTNTMGNTTVTYSAKPLPVELVAFEVVAKNGDALLSWRTAAEQNNDHFEVERSADGQVFAYVGQVTGQGTSAQAQAYTFTDAGSARFSRQLYYRLREVETSGKFSFSPLRIVRFAEALLPAKVLLYPNPTSANVTIDLSLLPAATYTVRVLSLTGQTLSTVELTTGQLHELKLTNLPAGMYVVRVQSADLSLTQNLVKLR